MLISRLHIYSTASHTQSILKTVHLQLFAKFLICSVKQLGKKPAQIYCKSLCRVVHIKKETNEQYPQSHVSSLNSLMLTGKFPLGSGCIAAQATATVFTNCFNYDYSSMISSTVRTPFPPWNFCNKCSTMSQQDSPWDCSLLFVLRQLLERQAALCSTPSKHRPALCSLLRDFQVRWMPSDKPSCSTHTTEFLLSLNEPIIPD